MSSNIRLGQLITPFGPGSIYTDKNGVPTVVCGLDYWYTRGSDGSSQIPAALINSAISEPRLSDLLNIPIFRQPPEYFYDKFEPDLSKLMVQAHRFPRWYVNSSTGGLKRFNFSSRRLENPGNGAWRPVRFITVCQAGHMSDFPWKAWIGCQCDNDNGLVLNDSGGVDLSSITVKCMQCKAHKTLSGATAIYRNPENGKINRTGLSKKEIHCGGEKPWLGDHGIKGVCEFPLAAVLLNQSNVYFSKIISSIFLPDLSAAPIIRKIQDILSISNLTSAKLLLSLGDEVGWLSQLRGIINQSLEELPADDIIKRAYESLGRGCQAGDDTQQPDLPESDLLKFRRDEFNILRNDVAEGKSTELRIISSEMPKQLQPYFAKVNLVERLRETRVFFGFDRLERSVNPLEGMPDSSMRQLFFRPPTREISWLPAVKNYGEGIYLELSEAAIDGWINENKNWLKDRYSEGFVDRMLNEPLLLPPSDHINWKWVARYQLVHTLAHILINQLVFESGYSSAALKERLFVSSDPKAPMAGVLIYTGSGDSDGSLGGLVRMGRSKLFESMLIKAVSRASWCSADPVCSENIGGAGSRLVNMAACYACTLLPETACETINNGLDRAAVIGVPGNQGVGFLSKLLTNYSV